MTDPKWPATWLQPDGDLPAGVRAVFTTREGGISQAPFDRFNLGDHVRDDAKAVDSNRRQLVVALGARPVFLTQVHGTQAVRLKAGTANGSEADACVSDQAGLACTIMVADCLPVLFAHASGRVVAAAHAGWRGLANGVLESCFKTYVDAVRETGAATDAAEIAAQTWVWLGPCIGPQAFEVGPEVRQAFVAQNAAATACFEPTGDVGGKSLANLSALARLRLGALGMARVGGNDGTAPWCTVSQPSSFFSHRRDAARLGSTGRMAACIWIGG